MLVLVLDSNSASQVEFFDYEYEDEDEDEDDFNLAWLPNVNCVSGIYEFRLAKGKKRISFDTHAASSYIPMVNLIG